LHFSRQRDFLPEPSDVNAVLAQVLGMVRRQGALQPINVNEVYAPDLPMAEMDVSRIKQVFLNILHNAVYAMKEGGSLTIRTSPDGATVRIAFEDAGPGIPPDILGGVLHT